MFTSAGMGRLYGPVARNTFSGGALYVKPKVERFGSLRDLTRIGTNADCDGGGVWGIGADGSDIVGEFDGVSCSSARS
jgi:hypothetical protein